MHYIKNNTFPKYLVFILDCIFCKFKDRRVSCNDQLFPLKLSSIGKFCGTVDWAGTIVGGISIFCLLKSDGGL